MLCIWDQAGDARVSKPNYRDIAALAGVGTATVERVLNGRGGVRPDLVEKVVVAARTLNYPRTLPDTHRGLLRIDVLMVRPETTFYRRLSKAFEKDRRRHSIRLSSCSAASPRR